MGTSSTGSSAFRTDAPHRPGRGELRAELDARRWQRISARVVVTNNGPLDRVQREQAALALARPGSALAGPTAAALDGLVGFEDHRIHLVVPLGSHRHTHRLADELVLHWSRRLGEDQIHPGRAPRRTRIERSLVDMSTWSQDPIRACAVLAAGVQQRLVRPSTLEHTITAARTMRHRRLLLLALADIAGGAQSFAEIDAARICRRAGLPSPQQQRFRRDASGRRRYLDLCWPEYGLVVEIDGGLHREVRRWLDDLLRQNEIVLGGQLVLRFPTVVVRAAEPVFVRQLTAGLRRGGWTG